MERSLRRDACTGRYVRRKWKRCRPKKPGCGGRARKGVFFGVSDFFTTFLQDLSCRVNPSRSAQCLIVIFGAEVGDEVFAHHPAESVFELHELDEEVVLGIKLGSAHGRLEVETEPFLDAAHAGAVGEIEKENKVEDNGRGEDGVAAEKVHFDLHGVAEPTEDVDVVPAFFVIAARRVIVDADLVENLAVKLGIKLRLENVFERAELRFFFGFEGAGVVEDFAVTVAENVGGEPAIDTEHAGLEAGG